jgi:hypothetical protein
MYLDEEFPFIRNNRQPTNIKDQWRTLLKHGDPAPRKVPRGVTACRSRPS